jgi:membrane protein
VARKDKKTNKAKQAGGGGAVENALVPVASLAVLTGAVVHSVLDRRQSGETVPLGYQPPGSGSADDEARADAGGGGAASGGAPAAAASSGRGGASAEPGGDARAASGPGAEEGDGGGTGRGDAADDDKPSAIRARVDAVGRRVPALGKALAVQRRFSELRGNNLAAAVTFQAFVSLFPLLLVIVAVVGFVSAGSSGDIAGSVVGELGLTGDAARAVRDAVAAAEDSRRAASIVGLAGLLWSGLGLVNALQFAYNQVWQVEERGLRDKAVGIGWLLGAVLIMVGASAVTTVLRWLPDVLAPVGMVAALLVNFVLWLWTAKVLPNRDVGWRALVPGAILGAVGLEILKVVGAYYVPRAVASSSQLYGSLGVVFAVLAWLLFFGRLLVYSAVLNVVLFEGKRGTVRTVIEVPAAPGTRPDTTTRSGRVQKEDVHT